MAELFVTENNETLEGTAESDILDATGFTGTTLEGLAGDDELFAGTDGILNGGAGNDTLDATADGGGNTLNGNAGDDTLFGNNNDTLNGGDGADRLFTAGTGGNTYTGNSGSDQFWLAQAAIPNTANTVTDFSQSEDVLGIAGLDGIAERFEDLTIEQGNGNTTIAVNDGSLLATLEGFTNELTADDFAFGSPQSPEPPTPPTVELSIEPASGSEEEETTFMLTATASAAVSGEQTVDLALSGANPADFTGEFPSTISIADGETTGSVEVTVNDDELVEGNETATFAISNPSEGIRLGETAEVSGAIADNDEASLEPIEPSSFLDNEFYLNNNSDVANAVGAGTFNSGLAHFLEFGLSEGRAPTQSLTFFSEDGYLSNNSDVEEAVNAGTFESGLDHFLSFGLNRNEVQERIAKGGTGYEFYNEQYYVNNNSDVQNALSTGTFNSGLEHFLRFGLDEGRAPSQALSFFKEETYLDNNDDVENAINNSVFDSAIEHFLRFGVKEGLDLREGTGYDFFESQSYLNENPDVAEAVEQGIFGSGLEHFVEFGFAENRSGVDIPENSEVV